VIDSNLMFLVVRESSGALIHIPNNLFFQKMFRVTGSRERSLFEEFEQRADVARASVAADAAATDGGRQDAGHEDPGHKDAATRPAGAGQP